MLLKEPVCILLKSRILNPESVPKDSNKESFAGVQQLVTTLDKRALVDH